MHLPQANKFWITLLSTGYCLLLLSHPAWSQDVAGGMVANKVTLDLANTVSAGSGSFKLEAASGGSKGSTSPASLITNSSFEYPPVAEGSYLCVTPGWGWTGGYGSVAAIVRPGDGNSEEPWASKTPAGMDGSNFCQLFANADEGTGVLYQDTGIKYQKGAAYTLSAAFGLQTTWKLARNCTMFLANSSLVPMAYTTIEQANLTAGTFTPQNISYMATGNEAPGDGTYGKPGDILVGFWLPASPSGSYLDFDNVRLSAPAAQSPTASAPAAAPPPSQVEPAKDVYSRWSVVGQWRVTHPDWTDVVTLRPDGTLVTSGQGTTGKWILTANGGTPMLIFQWDSYSPDVVMMVTPDHFRGKVRDRRDSFMDMQRGDAPQKPIAEAEKGDGQWIVGQWRVTHPDWTNVITLRADGSIISPDPNLAGKWILTADGGTPMLIFHWDLYGADSVSMVTPGHFRGQVREGVFMDMQRGDAPQKSMNDFASAN